MDLFNHNWTINKEAWGNIPDHTDLMNNLFILAEKDKVLKIPTDKPLAIMVLSNGTHPIAVGWSVKHLQEIVQSLKKDGTLNKENYRDYEITTLEIYLGPLLNRFYEEQISE